MLKFGEEGMLQGSTLPFQASNNFGYSKCFLNCLRIWVWEDCNCQVLEIKKNHEKGTMKNQKEYAIDNQNGSKVLFFFSESLLREKFDSAVKNVLKKTVQRLQKLH